MNKQNSKKSSRNKSLLPHNACIGGWCRDLGRTAPTTPPRPPEPTQTTSNPPPAADESSSRGAGRAPAVAINSAEECKQALDRALEAAHNVEVGDWSFEEKNYRGARLRYEEALELKAPDPAIHVRLARTLEKLNDVPGAAAEYQAAEKLGKPGKWTDEAHAALLRLQAPSH